MARRRNGFSCKTSEPSGALERLRRSLRRSARRGHVFRATILAGRRMHRIRRFKPALLTWLTFHGAMLIGEMVPVTLAYMRNNPLCDERTQFEHVIVDEFQDLNRAEQVLRRSLGRAGVTERHRG